MPEKVISQTGLGDAIDATEGVASYDKAAKQLLANKGILAWILQSCVPEFEKISVQEVQDCIEGTPEISQHAVHRDTLNADEKIIGDNTEDSSLREGTIYYDIRFTAVAPGTKEVVQIFINVEVQLDLHAGYPIEKRIIYYLSRMISAQYGPVFTNSDYGKIRKAYSIWIVPDPPKYRRNSIFKMSMQGENVVGDFHSKKENYDLMTGIVLSLSNDEDVSDNKVLKLLDVVLSRTRASQEKKEIMEQEYQIPYTKEVETEVGEMCNLGQGIYRDGRMSHAYDVVDRMIAKGNQYSDKEIAEISGLTEDEVRERRNQNVELQPAQ